MLNFTKLAAELAIETAEFNKEASRNKKRERFRRLQRNNGSKNTGIGTGTGTGLVNDMAVEAKTPSLSYAGPKKEPSLRDKFRAWKIDTQRDLSYQLNRALNKIKETGKSGWGAVKKHPVLAGLTALGIPGLAAGGYYLTHRDNND